MEIYKIKWYNPITKKYIFYRAYKEISIYKTKEQAEKIANFISGGKWNDKTKQFDLNPRKFKIVKEDILKRCKGVKWNRYKYKEHTTI